MTDESYMSGKNMKEVKFSTSGFFAPAVITLKGEGEESHQIELIAFIPREEPPVDVYKIELDADFRLQPTVAEILDEVKG